MVFSDDCSKIIFDEFPEFVESIQWKNHVKFWDGEKQTIGMKVATFSTFIEDALNNNIYSIDFVKVFNLIEYLLQNGDQTVQDAVATQFLENLINATSSGNLEPKKFIHLLGPESREYCKAWDEFTGVKTEGLWDNTIQK